MFGSHAASAGHLYLKRKDRAKALQCFLLLCDPDRVVGEQYGSSPRMSTSFISVGTLCYEEYLDRMKSGDDNVSYWLEQSHTALQVGARAPSLRV